MGSMQPAGRGCARDSAGRAAAGELLERIARLACTAACADEAAVLMRAGGESGPLERVAAHSTRPSGGAAWADDPAVQRALATGAAATGDDDGLLHAAAPLAWGGTTHGALAAVGGRTGRRFGRAELDALRELADLASATLEEAERRERLEEIVDAGVAALVRAVDMRDDYTGRHSESVRALARRVGERLGMEGAELWLLELAARLHDVGKIGVPDAILNKQGPLEAGEWEHMRRHSALGAEMLAKVPGLEAVAPLVRSHHERWDGWGYPDGLSGAEIPLASRVISVCDSLQAMTAERPYRSALGIDVALAELSACAGSQFDPAVVAALGAETDERRAPLVTGTAAL